MWKQLLLKLLSPTAQSHVVSIEKTSRLGSDVSEKLEEKLREKRVVLLQP